MFNPVVYSEDMHRLFGRLLHRDPWAGEDKLHAFQRTRELWEEEYHCSMDAEALQSQLNDANVTRLPAHDAEDEKTQSRVNPEDICSVFTRKSIPVVPSVRLALDHNFCTFSATGLDFAIQVAFFFKLFIYLSFLCIYSPFSPPDLFHV